MKKISKAIIVVLMILSLTMLASCGKNKDDGKNNDDGDTSTGYPSLPGGGKGQTPFVPYP